MGNIVTFRARQPAQAAKDTGMPVTAGKPEPGYQALPHVMLAVAYYVKEGKQKQARELLTYVLAHNPLPDPMFLPDDLFGLVGAADLGGTLFPA